MHRFLANHHEFASSSIRFSSASCSAESSLGEVSATERQRSLAGSRISHVAADDPRMSSIVDASRIASMDGSCGMEKSPTSLHLRFDPPRPSRNLSRTQRYVVTGTISPYTAKNGIPKTTVGVHVVQCVVDSDHRRRRVAMIPAASIIGATMKISIVANPRRNRRFRMRRFTIQFLQPVAHFA